MARISTIHPSPPLPFLPLFSPSLTSPTSPLLPLSPLFYKCNRHSYCCISLEKQQKTGTDEDRPWRFACTSWEVWPSLRCSYSCGCNQADIPWAWVAWWASSALSCTPQGCGCSIRYQRTPWCVPPLAAPGSPTEKFPRWGPWLRPAFWCSQISVSTDPRWNKLEERLKS